MTPPTSILGRPADRTNLIVSELRDQIVGGALPPGSQLPTRLEIEESFGAGASTVQKALEFLRRDGFIKVNGRQGTFVADNPPHLTNYALIFPDLPGGEHPWKRFWAALLHEVGEVERSSGLQINPYFGVDRASENPDYLRLVQEVRSHRLAGLIFASNPFLVEKTPVLEESGLERVAIMADDGQFDCRAVCPDIHSFMTRACEELARRGHRRVAMLLPCGLEYICRQPLESYLHAAGLSSESYWIQEVHLGAPEVATRLVHLLVSPKQTERPDALIIADDNLLDEAITGVLAAGIRVPQDLEIVAHCNFPLAETPKVPVIHLGFDAREVLRTCLANLSLSHDAATSRGTELISALFLSEYEEGLRRHST